MPPAVIPTAAALLPHKPRGVVWLDGMKKGARAPGGGEGQYGVSSGVPTPEAPAALKVSEKASKTDQMPDHKRTDN